MSECVYLGDPSKELPDGRELYQCRIHGHCTKEDPSSPHASCASCRQRINPDDPSLPDKYLDPLVIVRDGERTHSLRNLLRGRAAFFVCGGPSARALDLKRLNVRGIFSLSINNMAGYHWPNVFVCSDPPMKFHHGIWLDPTIMKMIPIPKIHRRRGRLRRKTGDSFSRMGDVSMAPNVWGFQRRSWMVPDDTFFTDPSAAWGNHKAGVLKTQEKKTACTMLLGFRILYYLGARTIYLVGVDWMMVPGRDIKDNYAFKEDRDEKAIRSNNAQFEIAGEWLQRLQGGGTFSRFGLKVYNCFEHTGLKAFPYKPFDEAISECLEGFPEEPFDLGGWYIK